MIRSSRLIIRDIAYTDQWYQPRLLNNRATMILTVVDSLQDRPVELHAALTRIDEFQRVRRIWDPTGKLRSAQSVRLLGDRPS